MLDLNVESYAGHRGEETPRRICFDARTVEVVEVIDRWHGPDHRYFKIKGSDGAVYILRHDVQHGGWELTHFNCYAEATG